MFIDHFIESSTVSLSSGGSSLQQFFEPQRLAVLYSEKKFDLLSRKKISRRKNGIQRFAI